MYSMCTQKKTDTLKKAQGRGEWLNNFLPRIAREVDSDRP